MLKPQRRHRKCRLARSRVVKSNRSQIVLFSILTLILTAATVWGGRAWLRNSETLIFAVGEANGLEARFAAKLAAVLKNNSSRLQLKIVPNGDNAKALAQFDRKDANLAILRTDAKIPPRARAVAILEHDWCCCSVPAAKRSRRIADLKKKKIAVLADSENSVTLIRNILELAENPGRGLAGADGAAGFDPRQTVCLGLRRRDRDRRMPRGSSKDKSYEQFAKRGAFTLNAIDAAKAMARKYPAVSEETVATGMLSASPAIPDDETDTIGLQWLLVAQSKLSTTTVSDLARIIYENKAELALDDGFASKIEPADDRQGCLHRRPSGRRRIHQ